MRPKVMRLKKDANWPDLAKLKKKQDTNWPDLAKLKKKLDPNVML
jgi:hypothetical protein